MALNDLAIRSAKPGTKPVKMSDERGLFLLVQPTGGKLWRLKYRIAGKEKKLALGRYPDVALKEARERGADARKLIAAGVDPSEKKRLDRLDAVLKAATTFKAVADEYIEKCDREGRAAVTVGKARWLLSLLEPALGTRPIDQITPVELLAALRKVEARGHRETARRMRSFASRVFRYAVATGRASVDPAPALRGALIAPKPTHHAAVLDKKSVGALLRAITGYDGQPMTQLALRLAPHVFVRPGELRQAEWSEIDLDASVWKISGSKMKMRQPHEVPLSRQATDILRDAQALTGRSGMFSRRYIPANGRWPNWRLRLERRRTDRSRSDGSIYRANGKVRPLGISTVRDRVCMTAAMLVLEPIFEADLPPEIYAYRAGRNAQQAVIEVEEQLYRGRPDVVDADLADYFDSIPHLELMKSVARRIVDPSVLHLIRMWLDCAVEETDD